MPEIIEPDRITSYNVCYTKLLRCSIARHIVHLLMKAFFSAVTMIRARITSYNVCYTKLLRLGLVARGIGIRDILRHGRLSKRGMAGHGLRDLHDFEFFEHRGFSSELSTKA